jgi:tRNA-specific 2-thiouridylase
MRAREIPRPAHVVPTPDGARVLLEEPAMPAPGQACVFYQGSRILGGGFIRRAEPQGDQAPARAEGEKTHG